MNVTDHQEVWQIDIGGQIYEANLDIMTQWIFEGALLRQDKVKRGNLRWIEAQKVPALLKFFNAVEQGEAPPVFVSTTDAQQANNFAPEPQTVSQPAVINSNPYQTTIVNPPTENVQPTPHNPYQTAAFPPVFDNQPVYEPDNTQSPITFNEPQKHEFNLMPTADFCSMHPEQRSAYLCGTCGNGFCPACPKSYGGTVKICPFCGAMCKSVKEVKTKTQAAVEFERDFSKGFGFADFGNAFAYPFKFKTSLFFGALMYAFFSLGQGAASMGSLFLIGAGLICWMLSNMLTFGVMANTVENFAQGKIGGNFMPSFDDFSAWDDVIHPFFLSIGVYLVSFGLVFLMAIIMFFWGLNQLSNTVSNSYTDADKTKILTDKNSPFKNNPNFKEQKNLYGDGEMPDENGIVKSQANPNIDDAREVERQINEQSRKDLESGFGKTPETIRQERNQIIQRVLGTALPILIFLGLGLIWGIFYFPAACCVAGYTRSFVATINPAIGLETIKLLGWDYVKIWLMMVIISIASGAIGLILAIIFAAFDMPTVGNIPAKAIGSFIGFYFSVVFSVVLGFALYKNADKMNLFKG